MMKVVFQMEEFHCQSCIREIETEIEKHCGVKSVNVLFHSGKVRVRFDDAYIDVNDLEDVIEKLGYLVKSKKSA